MARRDSHVIPESGFHTCDTAGTCKAVLLPLLFLQSSHTHLLFLYIDVLKFDNSYSWMRSKAVFHSIKVLPPDTDLCSPHETTPIQTETTPTQTEATSTQADHSASEDGLRNTCTVGDKLETSLTTEARPNV